MFITIGSCSFGKPSGLKACSIAGGIRPWALVCVASWVLNWQPLTVLVWPWWGMVVLPWRPMSCAQRWNITCLWCGSFGIILLGVPFAICSMACLKVAKLEQPFTMAKRVKNTTPILQLGRELAARMVTPLLGLKSWPLQLKWH